MDAAGGERFRDLTIGAFVDRLASSAPVPGGGSAAAVAAGFGAGLVTMVASLSLGRDRYAKHEAMLEETVGAGRILADRFLELADRDAAAYERYAAALKLPKDSEAEKNARAAAVAGAAREAAEVPLETLRACLDLAVLAERLAGRSNVAASSDLSVAALFAESAGKAAGMNVIVNLPAVKDLAWGDSASRSVVELNAAIEDLKQITLETVGQGTAREPVDAGGR
jgi:formiminotetrahydrofolate cyclodeaminase